jgi:hypothetical protein
MGQGQARKDETGRRRGRPALPEGEGKRYPLSLRTTASVQRNVKLASEASGRSIAQEAETRLEWTFDLERAFGSRELVALFRAMAAAADLVERRYGRWFEDYRAFEAVESAWLSLIREYRPVPREVISEIAAAQVALCDHRAAAPKAPDQPIWAGLLAERSETEQQEIERSWRAYEASRAAWEAEGKSLADKADALVAPVKAASDLGKKIAAEVSSGKGA